MKPGARRRWPVQGFGLGLGTIGGLRGAVANEASNAALNAILRLRTVLLGLGPGPGVR